MVEFVTNLVELLMNLAHIPRSIGVLVVPIHAAHGAPDVDSRPPARPQPAPEA